MINSSYTFTVKTASAMFMHGADKQKGAELRPPSIKGVMHFWFRALAGGMLGLADLWKLEGKIFGSSEAGQGVCVRSEGNPAQAVPWPNLLPHKQQVPSPAIKENEKFQIILRQNPRRDLQLLNAAAWSLWLALNLGGFGQRSRRGAGSLTIELIDPLPEGMEMKSAFTDLGSLQAYLEGGIHAAKSCFKEAAEKFSYPILATKRDSDPNRFPILSSGSAKIVIGEMEANTEFRARSLIMERRDKVDPSPKHDNSAFGYARGSDRLASPVIVHLYQNSERSFWTITTWFHTPFPISGKKELVEKFLKEMKGDAGKEVTLP